MIDKIYIETAQKIRDEFIETTNKISQYEEPLREIQESIESFIKDLESIKSNLKNKDSKTAETEIMDKVSSVEIEGNKYAKLIDPLNKKIEDLEKRENNLYNTLKEKYPKLSDEDIINELKKHLK